MVDHRLGPFATDPAHALIALDYDGSLAPIVDDPTRARPLPAARAAVARLIPVVGRVAVISGRPVEFLNRMVQLPVTLVGQYGLEQVVAGRVVTDPAARRWIAAVAEAAASADRDLPGVRVERKGGLAVALHWRTRPDRGDEASAWAEVTAARLGLVAQPGRLSVELRTPLRLDKGRALERLLVGFDRALFAGDDHGDLAAFDALDRLSSAHSLSHALRVAVRSDEAPPDIVARADVVVDGPAGLAALLEQLADAIDGC